MEAPKIYTALGLMSGTSLDGIDAAIIKTDGHSITYFGPFESKAYTENFKDRLRAVLGKQKVSPVLEKDLTYQHAALLGELYAKYEQLSLEIDVIGFHGHTIHHDPNQHFTLQVGDGDLLAELLNTTVVSNFRSADILAGGQGAPLTPIYHKALAKKFSDTTVIVNIGGVANVSFINDKALLAFDTGPGNAPIDDLMRKKVGVAYDKDGEVARQGQINKKILAKLLTHSYFSEEPPKSLDRNQFDFSCVNDLAIEDAAATLVAFTVETIALSLEYFPETNTRWLATGGGRHNSFMMDELSKRLGLKVVPVEDVGWNGDAVEAQAFAFLAVRSLLNLPLSFPSTTGVRVALTGGDIHRR